MIKGTRWHGSRVASNDIQHYLLLNISFFGRYYAHSDLPIRQTKGTKIIRISKPGNGPEQKVDSRSWRILELRNKPVNNLDHLLASSFKARG